MALPKKRHSRSRTRKRKAEWLKASKPELVECPQCFEWKMNHRVCPSCGYYKNREVLQVEE